MTTINQTKLDERNHVEKTAALSVAGTWLGDNRSCG